MSWWRKLLNREAPLQTLSASRRSKTYSADSGYVYQYSFQGFRNHDDHYEYVFDWTSGRGNSTVVTVRLKDAVLASWCKTADRELSASERFGVAKMALKAAFDSAPEPGAVLPVVTPASAEIAEIAEVLGL